MESAKYFSKKELACPCCGEVNMDANFLTKLDMLRFRYNKPIYLNSAYRCDKHNEEVGGVKGSSHTRGIAVDIKCTGREKYWLMKYAFQLGFQGVGVGKTFLHLDEKTESPRPNVWTY